ncbi:MULTISPECIES: DUF2971 domain-containing protein [unclassified Thioalkalivibrio]|uniref:DUF2971 domain-containing protein n=1 Tax=unclassified Thioalkalivibrio TaxID=2621013 RepID=UPI0012DE1D24|nr:MULTISPECIES: DUF2971 domain-containing protein [unclassified Thioalkalivibrio]
MNSISPEDTYASLIFSLPESERALDILEIKNFREMPKRLYRFRSESCPRQNPSTPYAVDEIRRGYVYASPANQQNDVFDSCLRVNADDLAEKAMGSPNDWIEYLRGQGKTISKQQERDVLQFNSVYEAAAYFIENEGWSKEKSKEAALALKKAIKDVSFKPLSQQFSKLIQDSNPLCSFTDTPLAEQMWGYYNDKPFQGACIEYNPRSQIAPRAFQRLTLPVQYLEGGMDATNHMLESLKPDGNIQRLSLVAALVKDKKWEHEREWRYCVPFGIGPRECGAPEITKVILGYQAGETFSEQIKEVCQSNGIPVEVATPDHGSRKVVLRPIDE